MRKISQNQRNSAILLLQEGNSIREIAGRLGLGKSTVGRILTENKSDVERSKGGSPSLLSVTDKNYCVQKVARYCEDSAVNVAKDLERDVVVKCNLETVRRVLRSRGLGSIEKPKKAFFRNKNIKAKLEWYRAHKDWTIDDWKRVIWTDETKNNRFNSDGRRWAWIRSNEELQNHCCK